MVMTTALQKRTLTESEIAIAVFRINDLSEVVSRLVGLAGIVTAAAIGGVSSARSVRYWMSGEKLPRDREAQLRFGLRLAMMAAQRCGPGATQAWFKGSNLLLHDRAPAMLLRDDFSEEAQCKLLAATRELIA
jgi:hypothetical protein